MPIRRGRRTSRFTIDWSRWRPGRSERCGGCAPPVSVGCPSAYQPPASAAHPVWPGPVPQSYGFRARSQMEEIDVGKHDDHNEKTKGDGNVPKDTKIPPAPKDDGGKHGKNGKK